MFIPLSLDDFRFLIDNYRFFLTNADHYTSVHTINNRKIESVTTLSAEYQCFITFSDDYKYIIGRGHTAADSEKDFVNRMQNHLIAISKRGRPKIGNVLFGCRIPQDAKDYLDSFCLQNNINQGELITELLDIHRYINSENAKQS